MDARHFDALARVLSVTGSRRRVLALIATVPLLGGVFGVLGADEVEGQGRRKRRKKAHKHGRGRRRKNSHKKSKCTPDSVATTCAGQCGGVQNNCQQAVDCGSCVCDPPCGICQTCDAQTGQCVPDPQQQGDACGGLGQVCQADGACSCDDTSCPVCRSCSRSGECTNPCSSAGCCDGVTCQPGTENDACGNGGITCVVCTGQEECLDDGNNAYVCTCVPDCAGKACGDDGCGGTCGTCSGALPACSAGQCTCPADSQACGGFCVPEVCGGGGSLSGCNCSCPTGVVCIPGAVCAPAPVYCDVPQGWKYCEAQGPNRRYVPPCPAGQILSQETCLCS